MNRIQKRLSRLVGVLLTVCRLLTVSTAKAEGTELRILQSRLTELGYEIGETDGVLGKKTTAALTLAQTLLSDAGFEVSVTGYPDAKTVELIMASENEALLRTLLRGSRGARVLEAQKRLQDLNLLRDWADGVFGAKTETAVAAFEEMLAKELPDRIQPDGRLSPAEYDLLMSDLRVYGVEAPLFFDDAHQENLEAPFLYAHNAILINAVTGETLLEKEADARAEPASTTKIMTLVTALALCEPDQRVTIPEEAKEIPVDSSRVPVTPGETMTMEDLLYGMMIRSGNDAANAVAVLCSGSTEAFAEEMNRKAAELGMRNSHFVNPHGYTAEDHYTTARDLVTAARYGLTLEPFRRIVTCMVYTMAPTEKRDALVLNQKWEIFDPASPFCIPHAAGIKSGYTSSAGFCYVGAYQDQGVTLLAAVMGGWSRNMAWTDLKRLFAYGMAVTEAERTE